MSDAPAPHVPTKLAPPKIAIVGRPNVGKSTLFNRLAGKKLALVHDRPGVTRDRKEASARVGGLDLALIDTAGFEDAKGDTLEAKMRASTEAALEEADLAVFVLDARAGVTPMDETFAELVRRTGLPVVIVANKCEGESWRAGLGEAFALGFGEPVALSAEHGDGISDLLAAIRDVTERLTPKGLDEDDAGLDPDDPKAPLRLAVVGRPNAGKSTLVNAILGEDRLIVGPEPGVTRDAVAVRLNWDGHPVRIHDTAGLRKKARIADPVEKLSVGDTLRAIRFAEVVILVLDPTIPFERQDLQIADLAVREGRALLFAVTKWDLVEEPQATLKMLREEAARLLPQVPGAPLLPVSGLSGRGIDALLPAALTLRKDWSAKVKTRDLNEWLSEAVARHPPPSVAGRRIKPRYIAQTKNRPPTFVLMCSRADALPESYKRYLINGIRQAFELPAVPIRIHVRSGKNPYAAETKSR